MRPVSCSQRFLVAATSVNLVAWTKGLQLHVIFTDTINDLIHGDVVVTFGISTFQSSESSCPTDALDMPEEVSSELQNASVVMLKCSVEVVTNGVSTHACMISL